MKWRKQPDNTGTDPDRDQMMHDLVSHGIRDPKVLDAMATVPRHRFMPASTERRAAYGDFPLPIGHGQTISQPFIVAYMTEKLKIAPGDRVLEIGTGSGYQAAILAELGATVYSVEIVPELAEHARGVLADMGYENVSVRLGSGFDGWPEHAPYRGIIGTCCPPDAWSCPWAQPARGLSSSRGTTGNCT
jgi:protein-L-isoaspartate(D-aspartate) O-methyltransferase